MKVKILRDVMVAGVRQDSGSSIDLDDHVAQLLIGQRQAEEYVEPAPKKAVKKPVTAKPKETPAPKADTPPPPASAAK
jgi:hypothetical protein